MANPDRSALTTRTPPTSPDQSPSPPGLTSPDLSKDLKARYPAIRDAKQCLDIWQTNLDNNRRRIGQCGQITEKFDGVYGPYQTARLAETGSAWKSNFSARTLGTYADIVEQRLVARIKQSPSVTASKLPGDDQDAYLKSQWFQGAITDSFRGWHSNDTFTRGACHESALYGRGIVAWPDQWAVFPKIYRTDKAFLPEGTEVGQWDVGMAQLSDYWQVHELVDRIRDKDAAKTAGWDIENCVTAINEAAPVSVTAVTDVYNARTFQDIVREVIPGYSWLKGINVIEYVITYVTEYDSSVTQRIIRKSDGLELFQANYPEMRMADFVVPWVFQFGNGKFYGSYGVGQTVYDICVQMEKCFNRIVDSFWNRGRIIAQVEQAGDLDKVRQIIMDDFIYVAGAQIAGNSAAYPDQVNEFKELYMMLSKRAEEMIGAFTPQPQDPVARPLAAQTYVNEIKEDERNFSTIDMLLSQWSRFIWAFQRRICRKGNPDEAAKACRARILEKLSEENLQTILESPPYQVTRPAQALDEQKRAEYLGSIITRNDPNYDQKAVRKEMDTLVLGAGGGGGLLLAGPDNTVVIEQTNEQQSEVYFMSNGQKRNAVPNDNHLIHMAYLKGQPKPVEGAQGQPGAQSELSGPLPQAIYTAAKSVQSGDLQAAQKLMSIAALYFDHYVQHFDFAAEHKQLGKRENDEKSFISKLGKLLKQVNDAVAKAQQEQQQQQQQPEGAPQTTQPMAA